LSQQVGVSLVRVVITLLEGVGINASGLALTEAEGRLDSGVISGLVSLLEGKVVSRS
jgi:hypothetical protein